MPKAVTKLGSFLRSFLRTQRGLQQHRFGAQSNYFQFCVSHTLLVSNKAFGTHVGHNSFHTDFSLPDYGTIGNSTKLHGVDRGGAVNRLVEKNDAVGGQLMSHVPNVNKLVFKDGEESLLASAIGNPNPITEASSSSGREGEESFSLRAPSADSSDPSRPAEVNSLKDSASPSASSHRKHSHRGHGLRRLPCQHDGCTVQLSAHGFPDSDATRCKDHILPGMVRFYKRCEFPGCDIRPSYTFPRKSKPERCEAHKLDGMIEKKKRPDCRSPGCMCAASHGHLGDRSPSFCLLHVTDGMVRIKYSRTSLCEAADGCGSLAVFGDRKERVPRFCFQHREEGMVDVRTPACKEEGCRKDASHGWSGKREWLRCEDHQKPGMVKKVKCVVDGCFTYPNYGSPGGLASRCKLHMEEGMENLNYRDCTVEWCRQKASFAFHGGAPWLCRKHRVEGMVDVVNRMCEVSGCDRAARFGVVGEAGSRCSRHKEEGMVRAPRD